MDKGRKAPRIVAHRGASHKAPENSLAAFRLAIEEGSDGIEMDVRLARGGVPVVFHDPTLKRFTGKAVKVNHLSARDLSRVPVGEWFNRKYPKRADGAYSREGVPTLEQVLELLEGFRGDIFVELKCRADEVEETALSVSNVIADADFKERFIVKSFSLDAIPVVRQQLPEIRTAALFAPKVMSVIRKEKRLVNIAADLGAESLSLHSSLATRKLMKKAIKAGLGVAVWTVDNPRWVKRAAELGVGAVITNRPDRFVTRRNKLIQRNSIKS